MAMSLAFAVWAFAAVAGPDLIENGTFPAGFDGWQTPADPVQVEVMDGPGGAFARISVPDSMDAGWPGLSQRFVAAPGDILLAHTEARTDGITAGYGAYFAVEFMTAQDQRISYAQSEAAGADWTRLRVRTLAPPDTAYAVVKLIVNGHGTGWFRNVSVEKTGVYTTDVPDGPVTLTVTKDVVCDNLIGFGAEDDGWFYNDENKTHGVDEAAIRLREDRVKRMDIDWVRMFFWYPDWNPSGDWESFTFDSVNMESHCRTLELYQKTGAKVTVVGVEWGMKDPFGDPEALTKAWGALLDYLVRERGYTCIKYWTLTNEPNSHFIQQGYTFERYVELHRLMAAEIEHRGLDIGIAGSDDTAGLAWFQQCAADETYRDVTDVFVSHRYYPFAERIFANDFYADRFDAMAGNGIKKPFAVAEFGFHDARSGALENPLMEDYDYALWTTEFIIEGLNRGVAGYTIWCLQEMYYPGNGFMNYGLWNFGGEWKVRPVYFAMLQFTQKTEPGMKVYRCASSHESVVKGACVGKTLFWVNNCDEAVDVSVEGLVTVESRVFEESTLRGEVDCSVAQPIRNVPASDKAASSTQRMFTAPPRSFGYCPWPVRDTAVR
ncbi:MAG: hypothetical protein KJ052_14515 [Candidatus Hydrogenedentes bacterium]|nr:hypothetical protein [Candidatus Hydrogenedentota bacterium]